jgi:hypothetical protein
MVFFQDLMAWMHFVAALHQEFAKYYDERGGWQKFVVR